MPSLILPLDLLLGERKCSAQKEVFGTERKRKEESKGKEVFGTYGSVRHRKEEKGSVRHIWRCPAQKGRERKCSAHMEVFGTERKRKEVSGTEGSVRHCHNGSMNHTEIS